MKQYRIVWFWRFIPATGTILGIRFCRSRLCFTERRCERFVAFYAGFPAQAVMAPVPVSLGRFRSQQCLIQPEY